MIDRELPPGHVRALIECRSKESLVQAARAWFAGERPTEHVNKYIAENKWSGLTIDPTFGAIPIGGGGAIAARTESNLRAILQPENSEKFLCSAIVDASGPGGIPHLVDGEPVYSDPLVRGMLQPCLPTCGTSQPVGDAQTIRQNPRIKPLRDHGLDGSGVGIAIVDSGIYVPRIERLLGDAMIPTKTPVNLDASNSWRPPNLVTTPGYHRAGHGTMCAYDALIAAPKATLVDVPMLLARPVADHHVRSTVSTAIQAYTHLLKVWLLGKRSFDALVVSNSWGIFHPSMEDYPPNHPYRFIDNPGHIFHLFTLALSLTGVDVIFCGNNCGNGANCAGRCASGTCLSETDRMIMGANAYEDVLTVGGCDTNDQIVGYSSRGPSVAGMFQEKPDLVAYTHFLGSRINGTCVPDTGVSAACPVAAGCVAALRTVVKPSATSPKDLFKVLKDTAYRPGGAPPGWKPDFGHGVINPVAAARALGVPIP